MVLYRKLFATREEGIDEITSYSATLWEINKGLPDSWQDFLATLQAYIDYLPLPHVVPEPGQKSGLGTKLIQKPGHVSFQSPRISFEVTFMGGAWRFTLSGQEINILPGGWEGQEEFPEDEAL